jgi:hypothetical protein
MSKEQLIRALEINIANYNVLLKNPDMDIKEYVALKRASDNYRLKLAEIKLELV